MVAVSAGRCDVKEYYGLARALLTSYVNCRVLPGSSPNVGSCVITGPTCSVLREDFKPKKVENRLHEDRKKALKVRVSREG